MLLENILHNELGMTHISTRWVPPLLKSGQQCSGLIASRYDLIKFEVDSSCFP